MAVSKRKPNRRTQAAFFEALPTASAQMWLPETPAQTKIALETLTEIGWGIFTWLKPAPKYALNLLRQIGMGTSEALMRGGRQTN